MSERNREQPEMGYENLLGRVHLDIFSDKESDYANSYIFLVAPNYEVYVSNKMHKFLEDRYGISLDETLIDGYIMHDMNGAIEKFSFQNSIHNNNPGFRGSAQELQNFKAALEKKIRESLSRKK